MKYVSPLTDADRDALEEVYHGGKTHRQRQRAQAVLLSGRGFSLTQLADILGADRDTVSGWLDAWQEKGLTGLADAPRPGRRRKIDAHLEAVLRDILIENPSPNMKALLEAEAKKRAYASAGTPSSALSGVWASPSGERGASRPSRRPRSSKSASGAP